MILSCGEGCFLSKNAFTETVVAGKRARSPPAVVLLHWVFFYSAVEPTYAL